MIDRGPPTPHPTPDWPLTQNSSGTQDTMDVFGLGEPATPIIKTDITFTLGWLKLSQVQVVLHP